jgi:hypothetical protein
MFNSAMKAFLLSPTPNPGPASLSPAAPAPAAAAPGPSQPKLQPTVPAPAAARASSGANSESETTGTTHAGIGAAAPQAAAGGAPTKSHRARSLLEQVPTSVFPSAVSTALSRAAPLHIFMSGELLFRQVLEGVIKTTHLTSTSHGTGFQDSM